MANWLRIASACWRTATATPMAPRINARNAAILRNDSASCVTAVCWRCVPWKSRMLPSGKISRRRLRTTRRSEARGQPQQHAILDRVASRIDARSPVGFLRKQATHPDAELIGESIGFRGNRRRDAKTLAGDFDRVADADLKSGQDVARNGDAVGLQGRRESTWRRKGNFAIKGISRWIDRLHRDQPGIRRLRRRSHA